MFRVLCKFKCSVYKMIMASYVIYFKGELEILISLTNEEFNFKSKYVPEKLSYFFKHLIHLIFFPVKNRKNEWRSFGINLIIWEIKGKFGKICLRIKCL